MYQFSSIAIAVIFVTFGRGFKKTGSVHFDIGDALDKDFVFKSITSAYSCIIGWCCCCVQTLP